MIVSNMSDEEFITEVKFQYYSTDMLTPKTVEELFKRFESLAEYKEIIHGEIKKDNHGFKGLADRYSDWRVKW